MKLCSVLVAHETDLKIPVGDYSVRKVARAGSELASEHLVVAFVAVGPCKARPGWVADTGGDGCDFHECSDC